MWDVIIDESSQDPEAAAKDFRDRIKNYEKVYQTIDESEKQYSYVKVVDLGWVAIIQMYHTFYSTHSYRQAGTRSSLTEFPTICRRVLYTIYRISISSLGVFGFHG